MPSARLRVASLLLAAALAACSSASDREGSAGRASGGRAAQLDTTQIPAELRSLAPLAAEWGIGADDEREQRVSRSTAEERRGLRAAVLPHDQRITAWLDTFGEGSAMSDEAAAFMYMRLAIEEMPEDG